MAGPATVDVVVVAFGSEETIVDCVGSVASDPVVASVVVVDNCSPDRSAERAGAAGATVVRTGANRGFGAGCNAGAAAGASPWILLLNPDASMVPGSLAGLVSYGEAHPGVAVVGSEVLDADGRQEPSRRRFPAWWRAFAEPGVAARWDEAHYRRRGPAGPVDWVGGSCLLVRRPAFEAVGGFDEGFFLYSEETDLCLRLHQAGHAVHWAAGFPSRHAGGASTRRLPGAGKEEWARGYRRYLAKHFRRPGPVRASLLVGLYGRALAWHVRGRRADRDKWLAAARALRGHGGGRP